MDTIMATHVTMRITFAPGEFTPTTDWSVIGMTLHIRALGAGTWATRITDIRGVQKRPDGTWRTAPRPTGFGLRRRDIPAEIRQAIGAAYAAGRRDSPATLAEAFTD